MSDDIPKPSSSRRLRLASPRRRGGPAAVRKRPTLRACPGIPPPLRPRGPCPRPGPPPDPVGRLRLRELPRQGRGRARQAGGLVFALGQIGYDLISEARRDSIRQHMGGTGGNPSDASQMLGYLKENPWEAASIVWTLRFDQTPLYAIVPAGPFAARIYDLLREFLDEQAQGRSRWSRSPGGWPARCALFNGQVVPAVIPELRGMYSWTTDALVKAVVGDRRRSSPAERRRGVRPPRQGRGRPRVPPESLPRAAQPRIDRRGARRELRGDQRLRGRRRSSNRPSGNRWSLDTIEVERSPICRPDSDCWDVKIHFFYPSARCRRYARCSASRWTSATWSP